VKNGVVLLRISVLALACAGVAAQQRDPTQPPGAQAVPGAQAAEHGGPALGALGLTVLVRNGVPYLASDTRLYAVGQTVGGYRIERLSETEIWLRKGRELQKIARFNGISRRAAAPERATP